MGRTEYIASPPSERDACERELTYECYASRFDFTCFIHHCVIRKCIKLCYAVALPFMIKVTHVQYMLLGWLLKKMRRTSRRHTGKRKESKAKSHLCIYCITFLSSNPCSITACIMFSFCNPHLPTCSFFPRMKKSNNVVRAAGLCASYSNNVVHATCLRTSYFLSKLLTPNVVHATGLRTSYFLRKLLTPRVVMELIYDIGNAKQE